MGFCLSITVSAWNNNYWLTHIYDCTGVCVCVCACAVWLPLVSWLCDPDQLNQRLYAWLVRRDALAVAHRRTYSYAANYERFVDIIRACADVAHLQHIRWPGELSSRQRKLKISMYHSCLSQYFFNLYYLVLFVLACTWTFNCMNIEFWCVDRPESFPILLRIYSCTKKNYECKFMHILYSIYSMMCIFIVVCIVTIVCSEIVYLIFVCIFNYDICIICSLEIKVVPCSFCFHAECS